MNICVVNGSPRGKYNTTLQTVLYLEKRFPRHRFEVVNVGTRISALEKDMGLLQKERLQHPLFYS